LYRELASICYFVKNLLFFVDRHVECIAIVLLLAVGTNDNVVEPTFTNGIFLINFYEIVLLL
jgi:hypothetical protein